MADFNYVHQIKDIEANSYNITDQRLYSDDKDGTTFKNIQLTEDADLYIRGNAYVNNVSESSAHVLLWKVSQSSNIADGVIVSSHISDSAIVSNKIADNAITNGKIDDYAVTANKIANTAVTETKIGDSAVTSSKIANGAVTFAKLDSTAYVVQQNQISQAFSGACRVLISPSTDDQDYVGIANKTSDITYNPSEKVLSVNADIIANEVETSKIYSQEGIEISSDGGILISGSAVSISPGTQITIPGYATESWVGSQGFVTQASLASYATTSYVDNRVVANPTGAASDQLSKIKIGSSVFVVPQGGGGSGTTDYTQLENKPQINNYELRGNVTTSQILSAGSGISISGSIISATAIYSAGSHISISNNNVISATYEPATTVNLGLIKLGSDTVQTTSANSVTSDAGRTYAVQLDGSGQAVVNVPFSMPSSVSTALITPDSSGELSIYASSGSIIIATEELGHPYGLAFRDGYIYYIDDIQETEAQFTDTTDTAGATQTSSKIYLVGAQSQSSSIQTYTNATVYASGVSLYASNINVGGTEISDRSISFDSADSLITYNGSDLTVSVTQQQQGGDIVLSAGSNILLSAASQVMVQNDYIVINGIRLYLATSEPSGSIPDNSIGIGW